MTNPAIDTRSAIETALENYKIFLEMGVVVNTMFGDAKTVSALNLCIEEFQTLSDSILSA